MRLTAPLVLASASPRRRALLSQIGIEAEVIPSGVDENSDETAAEQLVRTLAIRKADTVSRLRPQAMVLGADTTVAIDGRQLGKPRSREEAIEMLETLSGRTHVVHTGIAVIERATGRRATAVESTDVTFARLTLAEVQAYVSTGSPFDKAGGYGIQDDLGALLVSGIRGDFYNVVGLPLRRFYELLVASFRDRVELSDGRRY
jgi:septum formation protein